MKQSIRFWLSCGIALCGLLATSSARAQIASDRTLSTNVKTTDNRNFSITDGNRAGKNLFHSFSEFSVPTGGSVFFNNAADIQNIISRVTGESISNIDGLIRANGTANLFLLNPNGIIFGRNASLKIGGSFLGSTASSLNFADGTKFSATSPQTTPLLTISVPIGLQFGAKPGGILVQGDGQGLRQTSDLIDTTAGLHVQPNKTLAIVGGDIALEGGTLQTAGGRIELGSVAGSSLVSLTPIDKGFSLSYEGIQNFRDIKLSQGAAVDASGSGGGDIQVQGRRVTLTDGSQIEASTLGSEAGGTLSVNAKDAVNLSGTTPDGQVPSGLLAEVYPGATGAGGNLTVNTGQLNVRNGARVSAITVGQGDGGNLTVNASDSVEVSGTTPNLYSSGLFTSTSGAGAAGDLTIATGKLTVQNGAEVSAGTSLQGHGGNLSVTASDSVELSGTTPNLYSSGLFTWTLDAGAAGDLTIATGKLIVRDGALVSAGTFGQGHGGNLAVNASDSVELSGTTLDGGSSSGLYTQTYGAGAAGDLTIATGKLIVRDGAEVSSGTSLQGHGGNLSVTASDSVELSGTPPNSQFFSSGLYTQTQGAGAAGDLTITTGNLLVQNGARVSALTSGQGNGGNIQVNASSVNLSGSSPGGALSSGLFGSTSYVGQAGTINVNSSTVRIADGAVVDASTTGKGNITNNPDAFRGGTININANTFDVANGGQLRTNTAGTGRAGDITLKVLNNVTLQGQGSGLFANTAPGSTGDSGSISIDPNQLTLTDGASVSVDSLGTGQGASLNVQAGYLTLDNQASLSAAAISGEGGNITLNVPSLLLMRHNSQISTTSSGNGGNINIKTKFLVALPSENSDISGNAFTGRGGNVSIVAQGIFGTQSQPRDTPQSDIVASGMIGISGLVINPILDVVVLPTGLVDASVLIAQGCPAYAQPQVKKIAVTPSPNANLSAGARNRNTGFDRMDAANDPIAALTEPSKFIVSGRGGIPPSPTQPLSSDAVLTNWATLSPKTNHRSGKAHSSNLTSPPPTQIVEATGWVIGPKGEVILTAPAPTVTPDIPWLRSANCHAQ